MPGTIYADSNFYIAYLDPRDDLHNAAVDAVEALARGGVDRLLTCDAVLFEVLAYFSRSGPRLRAVASAAMAQLMNSPDVEVLSCSRRLIGEAIALYAARPDKRYSLTDCVSMVICRERGIADILTHDDDFAQEGFVTLL